MKSIISDLIQPDYVQVHLNGSRVASKLLTKEFIQAAYIDAEMTRKQLQGVYGISERLLNISYWHWFTKDERRIIGNRKIALAQRTRNSNRHNTGKPRVVLSREALAVYLGHKYSLEKMARLFEVAPQTVRRNLEYHGLADELVKQGVRYEFVITASAIDKFFGTSILKGLEVSMEDLTAPEVDKALLELTQLDMDWMRIRSTIFRIRRSLVGRLRCQGHDTSMYRVPGSFLNKRVKVILDDLGYSTLSEYELEGKLYDFHFIGTKYLLEIDEVATHISPKSLANDKLKNEIATRNGYRVIRLVTHKEKDTTIKKKLIKCLEPLKLYQLRR